MSAAPATAAPPDPARGSSVVGALRRHRRQVGAPPRRSTRRVHARPLHGRPRRQDCSAAPGQDRSPQDRARRDAATPRRARARQREPVRCRPDAREPEGGGLRWPGEARPQERSHQQERGQRQGPAGKGPPVRPAGGRLRARPAVPRARARPVCRGEEGRPVSRERARPHQDPPQPERVHPAEPRRPMSPRPGRPPLPTAQATRPTLRRGASRRPRLPRTDWPRTGAIGLGARPALRGPVERAAAGAAYRDGGKSPGRPAPPAHRDRAAPRYLVRPQPSGQHSREQLGGPQPPAPAMRRARAPASPTPHRPGSPSGSPAAPRPTRGAHPAQLAAGVHRDRGDGRGRIRGRQSTPRARRDRPAGTDGRAADAQGPGRATPRATARAARQSARSARHSARSGEAGSRRGVARGAGFPARSRRSRGATRPAQPDRGASEPGRAHPKGARGRQDARRCAGPTTSSRAPPLIARQRSAG